MAALHCGLSAVRGVSEAHDAGTFRSSFAEKGLATRGEYPGARVQPSLSLLPWLLSLCMFAQRAQVAGEDETGVVTGTAAGTGRVASRQRRDRSRSGADRAARSGATRVAVRLWFRAAATGDRVDAHDGRSHRRRISSGSCSPKPIRRRDVSIQFEDRAMSKRRRRESTGMPMKCCKPQDGTEAATRNVHR